MLLHQSHHIGADRPDPRVAVRRGDLHLLLCNNRAPKSDPTPPPINHSISRLADLDIDADDQAALLERAQVLAGHLEPRPGGAPEVEHGGARGDELVLLLYLDQLQRRGREAGRVRDL